MRTSSVNGDDAPQANQHRQDPGPFTVVIKGSSLPISRYHSRATETSGLRSSLIKYAVTEGTDLGRTG